jgi:putative hydrolase of the HAD superfamily
MVFKTIAFDADDTLWHNEPLYIAAHQKLEALLADYTDADTVDRILYAREMANLPYFGYGIMGFAFSMIETAIELTRGKIRGEEIQKIIDFSKEMKASEVKLLEDVHEVLSTLSRSYELMVITKGDLLDQEMKLSKSGIADFFHYVEIVSEKSEETYRRVLEKYGVEPQRFLMVGNSLKSNILPVVAVGGYAVFIPYQATWEHEVTPEEMQADGYFTLEYMGELPALIEQIDVK